jgi:hypothetical protein
MTASSGQRSTALSPFLAESAHKQILHRFVGVGTVTVVASHAVDGEPESASLRAIRQIPKIFLRAQKSRFGLRIGRENSALDFEFHFGSPPRPSPNSLHAR